MADEIPAGISAQWEVQAVTGLSIQLQCKACGAVRSVKRAAQQQANRFSNLYRHKRQDCVPPQVQQSVQLQFGSTRQRPTPPATTPDTILPITQTPFAGTADRVDPVYDQGLSSSIPGLSPIETLPVQQQIRQMPTPTRLDFTGSASPNQQVTQLDQTHTQAATLQSPRGVQLVFGPHRTYRSGGSTGRQSASAVAQSPTVSLSSQASRRSNLLEQVERMYQLPSEQLAEVRGRQAHDAASSQQQEFQQAFQEVEGLLDGRNKAQQFRDAMHSPADPEFRPSGLKAADVVSCLQSWRSRNKCTKQGFEELCQILQHVVLRSDRQQRQAVQSNNIPPTQYLMDRVINKQERVEIEYHACPCGAFAWPPYIGNYKHLRRQVCPCCHAPRVVYDHKTKQYTAPQPFWYFGLQGAITKYFMTNPDWSAYRGTEDARDNTFYNSTFATNLRCSLNVGSEFLDNADNSAYGIGLDWFEPFTWKTHAVGLVCLKCLDFEDKYLHIQSNVFPLMIISGPKEPKNFAPFAKVIADDFNSFGPNTEGMTVESIQPHRSFQHKVILGGIWGDTPAREKAGSFASHSALLACMWCVMNAVQCFGYRHSYWKGYANPVKVDVQKVKELPENFTAKVGNCEVKCTEEDMLNKGKKYVAQYCTSDKVNAFGATGLCVFQQVLPYFSLMDQFTIPVAHALGRGVGKNLWEYIFKPTNFKPTPPKRVYSQAGRGGRQARGQSSRGARRGRAQQQPGRRQRGRRAPGGQTQGGRTTGRHGQIITPPTSAGEHVSDAQQVLNTSDTEDDPHQGSVQSRVPSHRRGRGGTRSQAPAEQPQETARSMERLAEWHQNKPADIDSRVWYNGNLLTPQDKKLMASRAAKLILNCDCDEVYVDIVKKNGSLSTVEQYMSFFDAYGPLITRNIVIGQSPQFTTIVNNVQAACVWFCRPYLPDDEDAEEYTQALARNAKYLRDYAEFIECNGLPDSLLRSNLHMVICRLETQCRTRGHSGVENELFIERMILQIKRNIRGKVSQHPEKVIVNYLLLRLATDVFSRIHRTTPYEELTEQGMAKQVYEQETQYAAYDDFPEHKYYQGSTIDSWEGHDYDHRFTGWGRKLLAEEHKTMSAELKQTLASALYARMVWDAQHTTNTHTRIPPDILQGFYNMFSSHNPDYMTIRLHDGILLRMQEQVLSVENTRETKRQSCWVLARLKLRNVALPVECVVKVHKFAYCKLPKSTTVDAREATNAGVPFPFRLAFITAYKTQAVVDHGNILYKADLRQTRNEKMQAVDVDYLLKKVVCCKDDDAGSKIMWCRCITKTTGRAFN